MLNVGRLVAVMILAKKAAGASKRASGWLVGLFSFFFNKVGPVLDVGLLAAVMILAKKAGGAAGGASIATFAQSAKLALAPIIKIIAVWCKKKFV